MTYYGLYKKTICNRYNDDGGGSSIDEEILATDESPNILGERWNAVQEAKRVKLKTEGCHISYINQVPPNFPKDSFELDYVGNSGGGYSSVRHYLKIKPIPQFDEKKI